MALSFKALRRHLPEYEQWHDFACENEFERLATDLINDAKPLHQWVDDNEATSGDLDKLAQQDEGLAGGNED